MSAGRLSDIYRRLQQLDEPGRELFRALLAEQGVDLHSVIWPVSDRARIPAALPQQRIWILQQLDPANPYYNVEQALVLRGDLDCAALQAALGDLVARHEALRTTFGMQDGELVQVVHPAAPVPVPYETFEDADAEALAARLGELVREPFDLRRGPVIRSRILRRAADEHVLLIVVHHIVADAWSGAILIRELAEAYDARCRGRAPEWTPLPIQYADFAAWQRGPAGARGREANLRYWKEQLSEAPQWLRLAPFKRPSAARSDAGANELLALDGALATALETFGRRERVSLFATLLAAYVVLLHRHTGERDILIGTPFANRSRRELESVVGFLANTLVLRVRINGDPSFRELVQEVRAITLDAIRHADLPFEELVKELNPDRDLNRPPLFQVWFGVEEVRTTPGMPGLSVSILEVPQRTAYFDLALQWWHSPSALSGKLEYSTDLFAADDIRRMLAQLERVLRTGIDDPATRLSAFPLADAEDARRVTSWNAVPACETSDFLTAFGEQVSRHPERPACIGGGATLTFEQLDRRANGLAGRLRRAGVRTDEIVGLCLPPGPDLAIALIGIWKAGAAALLLEPNDPAERRRTIAADAGGRVAVIDPSADAPGSIAGVAAIAVDATESGPLRLPPPHPESAACVFYTSGSTGTPRGVIVPHRVVSSFAAHAQVEFDLGAGDRFLQFAPVGFDVLLEELLPAWRAGATVVFRGAYGPLAPAELLETIEREGVTHVELPAFYWTELIECLEQRSRVPESLRVVLVGCERIRRASFDRWRRFGIDLIHVYGLTELGVTSTTLHGADAGSEAEYLPTGRPFGSARLYVLGERGDLVGEGMPGELFVGGPGVTRCYLGDPGTTAWRYVPDPLSDRPGARMMRTGDIARWRRDGTLEILGRADRQVKVRGCRVELPEIEAALAAHPDVRACHVDLAADARGEHAIVAYIAPRPSAAPVPASLSAFLAARLPSFMQPAAFVFLPALPYTAQGKLDRDRLPPIAPADTAATGAPPAPGAEQAIAAIWRELLGVDAIPADVSFFDVGGHSLKAMQLVSRLRAAFAVDVPLRDVFDRPTIREIAATIGALQAAGGPRPIERRTPEDTPVLSFAQEALWFLHQIDPASPAYNLPAAVTLEGELSVEALERSLRAVVERHETLRTTIQAVDGQPRPEIATIADFELRRIDLTQLDGAAADAAAASLAAREHQAPFDLERGPLMRATLLALSVRRHVLLVTIHHIFADGWSVGVLLDEVRENYAARVAGREPVLPELPIQYTDFAIWQRRELAGPRLESHVQYWIDRLRGAPAALAPRPQRPRPAVQSYRGATVGFELSPAIAQSLRTLGERHQATLYMVLVAGFQALLHRWTGATDVVLGSFVANRDRSELEPLVGLFVNAIVLRTDISGDPSFDELVEQMREVTLAAYAHGDVPFEMLVDRLGVARDLSRNPLFQVAFSLDVATDVRSWSADVAMTPYGVGAGSTQFDLSLDMNEAEDGLAGRLTYATDLYDESAIAEFVQSFVVLLESAVRDPGRRLSKLDLLSAEQARALAEWTGPPAAAAHDCIDAVFAARVRGAPDHPCLVSRTSSWTFADVDRRANAIAHRLRTAGVGPEVPVAVILPPSPMLGVAMMGIFKAGGACLCLDVTQSPERLASLVREAGARHLITRSDPAHAWFDGTVIEPSIADSGDARPPAALHGPSNLAYIVHTSGSTGAPRRVGVSHEALAGYSVAMAAELALAPSDRFLQFASPAFDVLYEELCPAWSAGASIAFHEHGPVPAVGELVAAIDALRATIVELPAAYWRQFVLECSVPPATLRRMIVGCEPPAGTALQRWQQLGVPLTHVFGLAEASTTSTVFHLPAGAEPHTGPLPIGRPLSNTTLYVLDAALQQVPATVPGALYIGGPAVARGYVGDPAATAERFVPDPFSATPGAQLYATGDVVRLLGDGNLEFIGRMDDQINLRGFRVEPAEIEAALRRHPAIGDAAVVMTDPAVAERPSLIAYVTTLAEAPSWRALREFSKELLPAHMVPAHFVVLDALPTTVTGKIDRRQLPRTPAAPPERARRDSAPTPIEALVIAVWEDVLGADALQTGDDFFEAGGDSLLTMRVVAQLRARGFDVTCADVFRSPIVEDLAAFLARAPRLTRDGADESAVSVAARDGRSRPLAEEFPAARLTQEQLERLLLDVSRGTYS